jgi:hypothetical protein
MGTLEQDAHRTPEERLADAEKLLAEIYRFQGTSRDVDVRLWFKVRNYCVKNKVPEPGQLELAVTV